MRTVVRLLISCAPIPIVCMMRTIPLAPSALRKLVAKGMAAYSENEKGQKVYWLTEFGRESMKEDM